MLPKVKPVRPVRCTVMDTRDLAALVTMIGAIAATAVGAGMVTGSVGYAVLTAGVLGIGFAILLGWHSPDEVPVSDDRPPSSAPPEERDLEAPTVRRVNGITMEAADSGVGTQN